MKKDLCDPEILTCPKEGAGNSIKSDASIYGIGALLLQEEDEICIPIGFVFRNLKGAEINYTVTEKECFAVVIALQKCRHYFHGRPTLDVISDQRSLKCF